MLFWLEFEIILKNRSFLVSFTESKHNMYVQYWFEGHKLIFIIGQNFRIIYGKEDVFTSYFFLEHTNLQGWEIGLLEAWEEADPEIRREKKDEMQMELLPV